MLCDRCKKRQATITITEVINNVQTKIYLCEQCANETKGTFINSAFEELLSGIIKEHGNTQKAKIVQCNNCGMTLDEFRKSSKIGCANCYTTFYHYIVPILKRIHGSIEHTGKMPIKQREEIEMLNEIARYQKALKEAVVKEEYEEAARYRDIIRDLKKGASE